jgi:hypothetical protein
VRILPPQCPLFGYFSKFRSERPVISILKYTMIRIFLLLFLPFCLFAQIEKNKSEFAPCGAPVGIDPWLQRYKSYPQDYGSRSSDTLVVAMQVHLVANDNGSGRFSTERLLDAFCRLNSDYAPAGIRFYFKHPWNLINNSVWYIHDIIPKGIDMMLTNNVPDALNTYFVQDPAGNCGYNLPYGGIAMNHSCANPTDHTWAHETGHALSLPHPFIGWEGKTYSFNIPTPELLTYDYTYFHDTIDTVVPSPLDTALVEYVSDPNCAQAADLFCDTKPDYLSYRWNCNNQNNSLVKMKDPAGNEFYSDGTLYMSYSSDECQNRFSLEQIAAMRANLQSEKLAWLSFSTPEAEVTETPKNQFPENAAVINGVQTTLSWSPVPNATFYHLIGSRISSLALREIEVVTTDTSLLTPVLLPNKKYYWKVRAFNNYSTCAPYTVIRNFTTGAVSASSEPEDQTFQVYPSLMTTNTSLQMECPAISDQETPQILVFDAMGRLMLQQTTRFIQGKTQLSLPANSWAPGMYQIVLIGKDKQFTQRFVRTQF